MVERSVDAEMLSRMLIFAGRVAVLAVVGTALGVACVAANFSADVVTTEGKKVTKGKVFVTDQKVRRETSLKEQPRITIVRADKGLTWLLKPKEKTYTEMKGAKLLVPDPEDLKKFSDEKMLGPETVAGYACKKYLYIPKDAGGAMITLWISDKLKWPLKVQIVHLGRTIATEYQNIREVRPKSSLFELPYDYKLITPDEPKTVAPKG